MPTSIRFALPAMLAFAAQFPGVALAQASAHPAPMNPAAAAAPLVYESAFAGYKPGSEPALVPWKESNARVAQPLPGEHDNHAGHDMGAMKPVSGHKGHEMGSMDHSGHKQAVPASKKDPHQGHQHKE